jgi:hemerythrin-like domain-containing protein
VSVVDLFEAEHGVLLCAVDEIERMLDEGAPAAMIVGAVRAVQAALDPHRRAEEELLYSALARATGVDFPPLNVLEAEHDALDADASSLASGGFDATLARGFCARLRDHLEKEREVIFPLAVERLAPDALRELARRRLARARTRASSAAVPTPATRRTGVPPHA